MTDWKRVDWKMTNNITGVETAGLKNDGRSLGVKNGGLKNDGVEFGLLRNEGLKILKSCKCY